MALAADAPSAGRAPRTWDFVRLKLRLMGNGFRGQVWRIVAFIIGLLFGLWISGLAFVGLAASGAASRDVGYVVAAFTGSAILVGWTLVPLLFFGVDETLDPARFALLPLPRFDLARGMLAAAFVGVPALATLLATLGLVVAAGIRFGAAEAAAALAGVVAGLVLGVIASRAVTSAFAALLRSRRVRDLAVVLIAVLASSIAPLQWLVMSTVQRGSIDQALRVSEILGWTPLGAPYVLPFDIADGRWAAAGARMAMTVGAIGLLLWWWSHTIESAMIGVESGGSARQLRGGAAGAVTSLMPGWLRGLARPTAFGAILARESRFWWRDPRRRASLVSILMASAVLPIALNFASRATPPGGPAAIRVLPFGFAVTMAGTMGGMLLGNQFAFDGNAFAAHLLGRVPGRLELRARAMALGLVTLPVQVAVVVAVTLITGTSGDVGAGLGMLAAGFGAAIAAASLLSVLAPYPLPENTNPFALNSGGASAKGLLAIVAMIGTLVICTPVVLVSLLLHGMAGGHWIVLGIGVVYGSAAAWLGTVLAGDVLDRRGPELLAAVTPRR
jgi:ABC-2 type transport system permease protein